MGFKSGTGNVTDLDVSGTFKANAGPDGIHQVTGSLHITGSEGASLRIQSRGDVSLRLEADTNNSDESQNPFIELVQDGGLTDYTIGLTQGARNPEGDTVLHITDNTLAMGSNIPITSTKSLQQKKILIPPKKLHTHKPPTTYHKTNSYHFLIFTKNFILLS